MNSTAKKSQRKQQKYRGSSTASGNQQGKVRRASHHSGEGSHERRMKTQEEIDIKIKERQAEIEKLRRFRDQLLLQERELSRQSSTSPIGIFSADMFNRDSSKETTQVISKKASANKKSTFNYV